jgi:hypothetical protein
MRVLMKIGVMAIAFSVVAAPAYAVGLGDLAKVVLGGGSVLKKGQQTCGSSLALSSQDSLTVMLAREAAKKALPALDFQSLDAASEADAAKAAQSPNFCNETKKKKPGLLSKIGKAGKALAKLKGLGL